MEKINKAWIARDKDGKLCLYRHRPIKQYGIFCSIDVMREYLLLPENMLPECTWDNSPIEVELTIKIKKHGTEE